MYLKRLLIALLVASSSPSFASDENILAAQEAYRAKNRERLAQLATRSKDSPLGGWVAYWEQTNRLSTANFEEFKRFKETFGAQYVTDRLRNDWLLELGRRKDYANFAQEMPNFIMRDDAQVECYDLTRRHLEGEDVAAAGFEVWMKTRDGEACHAMGEQLLAAGKLKREQAVQRARRAVEQERPRTAQRALAYAGEGTAALFAAAYEAPSKALSKNSNPVISTLALARLAKLSPESAALWLEQNPRALDEESRSFAWGQIGRAAALNLDANAASYFKGTGASTGIGDDALVWKVRAALRARDWAQVVSAVAAMSPDALRDPAWTFWHGYAQAQLGNKEIADKLYQAVVSPFGFYGQLAGEELGQRVRPPAAPAAPAADAVSAMRANGSNGGIARALKLFSLGLRSEAVREWNFALRGMSDAELHAASEVACQAQIWDRCINTSERTKSFVDVRQRYAMPFRDAIRSGAQLTGLEEAYVFGLIRQESRFIVTARSGVGASGLMQLMPGTAKWTATKFGIDLSAGVNDIATNVALGTGYLKLLKDEFEGSEALAAAGYNAGPGRPRKWRSMPRATERIEAAIFTENVPFLETRDYIKNVLSNATVYAALISGSPQSLKARLKPIARAAGNVPDPNLP